MSHIKGFTLIELLVVISIIALLSSIGVASLNTTRAKARDTKRRADITAIRTAMQLYYDKYATYQIPGTGYLNGGTGWFTCAAGSYTNSAANVLATEGFLSPGVKDPKADPCGAGFATGNSPYMIYACTAGFSTGATLWASLENPTATDIAQANALCGASPGYGMNYGVEAR